MAKHRRGSPGARSARKRRAPDPKAPPAHVRHHPLYGDIPLIVVTWIDHLGCERGTYQHDPDYRPPLPPGAVRGDARRQPLRTVFDTPRYFYVDEERTCIQCREEFSFGAREQKYWYETLRFPFESVAIRCPACRRQTRSDKALHHAVAEAKRRVGAASDDPAAWLALAEAIVQLHERLERGNLDQAIAAARKARVSKEAPLSEGWQADALYWEATAQARAGREGKARALYEAFVEQAKGKVRAQRLRKATKWLEAHPVG
ncbi:zinc-ribbon domain containing protein [Paraliomyxa miuraensis]|uniref:zinc-ribbon domain containing protein n=1 Tax=Paraliomyxa miuraensis TaxID=376150 RepID=UPI002257E3A4|nr:zinc-ribbon domain containing protein [Paraliomyxa miuraensis]MCX4247834.1 zinc-ribbon domain-containing protein [Paraliomyxa miuraensis]